MEFKPNNWQDDRSKIKVPQRADSSNNPLPSLPSTHHSTPVKNTISSKDLASQRESLGFDDIPMDEESMDGVQFRDIFRAWTKQAVKNTPIEKKLRAARGKREHLNNMKNDLKWALQADLDEPVKPKPKQPHSQITAQVNKHGQLPNHQATLPQSKSIDININIGALPKIPKIKAPPVRTILARTRQFLFSKKMLIIVSVIILLIAGYFASLSIAKQYAISKNAGSSNDPNRVIDSPDYGTFLPANKDINALGGWKRVSPPKGNPVFAYADKIDNIPVSVSQQPLPDSFHPDVDDQVAELAKGFNATDKFDADGIKVYVGTSSKGPQSTIFVKKDTLILIKSQAKISDDSWASYAKSLK